MLLHLNFFLFIANIYVKCTKKVRFYEKGIVKWFEMFLAGDFSVNNPPLPGMSAEVHSNQIKTLLML